MSLGPPISKDTGAWIPALSGLFPVGEPLTVWIPWALGVGLLLATLVYAIFPRARDGVSDFRTWRRARRRERWMRMGHQMMENGDHEEAMRCFQNATKAFPHNLEAWHALASCLEDAQRFEEATEAYVEGHEKTAEGEPGFLMSAARCALHADDPDRAVDLLIEASKMSPSSVRRMLDEEEYSRLREHERMQQKLSQQPPPRAEVDIV